jgi:hypothetical protein
MLGRSLLAHALTLICAVVMVTAGTGLARGQTVFINEIHYDNTGTDSGEAVEIAGPAGTNVGGWSIVRYNGSTPGSAVVYTSPGATETLAPGTLIPGVCGAFGVVVVNYPQDGLQNGPNDAIALVNNLGVVVQFLSYGPGVDGGHHEDRQPAGDAVRARPVPLGRPRPVAGGPEPALRRSRRRR